MLGTLGFSLYTSFFATPVDSVFFGLLGFLVETQEYIAVLKGTEDSFVIRVTKSSLNWMSSASCDNPWYSHGYREPLLGSAYY